MKFYIKPSDQKKVEKKINTLISKLSNRPTVTFSEPMLVLVRHEWYGIEGKCEQRKRRCVRLVEVTVSDVFVNDWVLVANISHVVNAMHIVSYKYGKSIPTRFSHENTVCELCGKKHARRHTSHVLYNPKTVKWMQVGTSCLHKLCDAGKHIATFADKLVRIYKEVGGFDVNDTEGLKRMYSTPDHSDFDIAVDKYDLFYVAKKYYDTHKEWVRVESRRELMNLFDEEANNDTLNPDFDFADMIIDYIDNYSGCSDFVHKIKQIVKAELVNTSDIAMVYWAIKIYFDDIAKNNFTSFCNSKNIIAGNKYRVCGKCVDTSYSYNYYGDEIKNYHILDNASGLVFKVHTDKVNNFKDETTDIYTFIGKIGYISLKTKEVYIKGRLSKAK